MGVPRGHGRERGFLTLFRPALGCGGAEALLFQARELCSSLGAGLWAEPGAAEQEGCSYQEPGRRFQKAKLQCIPIFQNRKNKTNQSRCSNM